LNECKSRYRPKIKSYYYDREYSLDVSFVFFSRFLPEQTKIGSIYDKHILTVTPEILESLDMVKMWRSIRGKQGEI
jgi:hypothetical protein